MKSRRRSVLRRLAIALLLVVLVPATALAALSWRTGTVNGDATNILRDRIAAEHKRVCGASLSHDSQLVWAARWKAQDMGYRGYFAHRTPDGKMVWDFYSRAGIPWRNAGEILAWNTYPDAESPGVAYRQFMDSSGHRARIRDCTYTRFGVGVFKVASGKKYYAVEFTRP
jgi:uncharacterized protein YkwD